MQRGHIQLSLELELGSEPITGSIGSIGSTPRNFCGWSELAALIERYHSAEAATAEMERNRP